MKLTRKFLALLLCLTMVLGMAATVFADGVGVGSTHEHYISIENNREGYVYEAYQIFAGDVDSTGVLSNISWGSAIPAGQIDTMMNDLRENVPAFSSCTDVDSVATILAGAGNMDDPIAIAFADVVSKYATVSKGTSTFDSDTGKYSIYNLPDGYYLVKNTVVPDGTNTTYTRYLLKVVADVNIFHKGDFPEVEKKITEDGKELDTSEAYIGQVINYKIEGTLPSDIDKYSTYYYVFQDTMSKGLTFNNDVVVTIDGVNVTDYFYKSTSPYEGSVEKYIGGTNLKVGIQDLLALEQVDGVGKIKADTMVVVTYSATLNENAVVGGYDGNPNKVYLEYDNNPNNDGDGATNPPPTTPGEPTPVEPSGKTPEDEVTTLTTQLTIQKVDGAGKVLTGAEFTLTSDQNVKMNVVTKYTFEPDTEGKYWKLKDGTYTTTAPKVDDPATPDKDESTESHYDSTTTKYSISRNVTVTPVDPAAPYEVAAMVDENGLITFTGLGAGTYTLTETVTPAGFNTMDPITFTISFAHNNDTDRYEFYTDTFGKGINNVFDTEIENLAGSTLPSTGGMGTTLFYVFGSIMVVAAVVLLITKKRMAA